MAEATTISATSDVVHFDPSSVPNGSGGHVPSDIQQKYADERNKRLRPDGTAQYIDLSKPTKWQHYASDLWKESTAEPISPALTDGSRINYLIIGAGFGGLLLAVRLIQAGIPAEEIYMTDSAGGFGGTWYWNRYPGLMCDTESYIYMPLLEEIGHTPKHKYAYGPELRGHADAIADKYGLRKHAFFSAETKQMIWNEEHKEWVVSMTTKSPEETITVRAQFAFLCAGLLNVPKLPGIPGIDDFAGHSFHTSRWDYVYTGGSPTDSSLANLRDKRVGIIGTGATAVQAVPHLAKWAKELYVFQRTPSSVDIRGQHATDPSTFAATVATKPGWWRERCNNFNSFLSRVDPLPEQDLVGDRWSKLPTYYALLGSPTSATLQPETIPAYVEGLHVADLPHQESIRRRVDEMVSDKKTAEDLKPWYATWCKRPCFHDDYLPSFNLPNVHLVDTNGKGVDHLTPTGAVVSDTEYPLDLLIFSTGFNPPAQGSPAKGAGIEIWGTSGLGMEEKWDRGVGTLHGVLSRGFPNLFFPGPLQVGTSANWVSALDQMASHIAYIVSTSLDKAHPKYQLDEKASELENAGKRVVIQPSEEGEEAWCIQIMMRAMGLAAMRGCTPSYLNSEGGIDKPASMEEQMRDARRAPWGWGILDYSRVLEEWRTKGNMEGLDVAVF